MASIFFSIGSNQGDRLVNLQSAIDELSGNLGEVVAASKIYESEPWGFKDQNEFLNQVIWFETSKTPESILETAMEIEDKLGRKRTEGWKGYESRVIDIDLLIYDDFEINTRKLAIPHPKMHLRNFVLIPFAEIAPEIVHPFFRETIAQLKENCIDKSRVTVSKIK